MHVQEVIFGACVMQVGDVEKAEGDDASDLVDCRLWTTVRHSLHAARQSGEGVFSFTVLLILSFFDKRHFY